MKNTTAGQRTGTKILTRALHEIKQSNIWPALSNAHESEPTSSVTCCITEGKIKTAMAHTTGGGAEPQRERKELRREAAACGIREP
jgi:L-amino acid N-acyltransferase YncA